jgi:cob(I)alamin adenosyltransferase
MTVAQSVVLINTGHGKGKSSAAFGVMGRAWARGWKVLVIQFVKSGKWKVGEKKLAEHLGIEFYSMGDGFTWESEDLNKSADLARAAFNRAKKELGSGNWDLIILDELTYPIKYGWIDEDIVINAVKNRSPKTNVVITGRDASENLIEIADTVTEMKKIKHAYDHGIKAKKGIEY